MTLAGYMALLPDWWSRDWAKTMLLEFSAKDLNEAFKLILNRGFMEVSADGKGPLYFDTGSLKVKLRLLRLSPKEKSEVRQIILRDEAGAADLQRGVMNEALWAKLRREGLSPELTYSDDLSIYCGRPDRSESVCRAAALLLASWLVSSDPALMFAWRGLGIYDDLNIPRIPVRHLPNGNEPAYVTHLPAARNVLLAEVEPKVLTEEGRAVAGRWATRPYALAWLLTELPLGADLSRADALAPRLGGFTISDSSRGRELRANLEIPDGQTGTVSVSFAKLSPGYEDRLRKYLSEHREECLTIGLKNDLTPGIFDEVERICPGFFVTDFNILGGIDEGPADQALKLRAAAAMSRYPRLLFLLRGIDVLPYAEYHRTHMPESTKPRRRRNSRRRGLWDFDYDYSSSPDYDSLDDDSDDSGDDFGFHDLSAESPADREPDEPGSAPWVRGWLSRTGIHVNSEGEAGARAALREGRAGDFVFDPEKHILSISITDEFGGSNRVTLAFPQYGGRERGLIGAILHLYPECLADLRKGTVSAALQHIFGRYSLPLLPDGEEVITDPLRGSDSADACALVIKLSQVLSDDPALLIKWRGFDISDGSSLEPENLSPESLLEVCAPGDAARRFLSIFIPEPMKAPLVEAAVILSGKTVGRPALGKSGAVGVSIGKQKGREKKTALLTLKPLTCAQAAGIVDGLDRDYIILRELCGGRKLSAELSALVKGQHAELAGGTLTMDGADVTDRVMADPLLTAAIIRLAQAVCVSPELLFVWRGLPLGRASLGEIRAELAGKSPDEPFMMMPPARTDYYFEKTLSYSYGFCLLEPQGSFRWWGNEWLDRLLNSDWNRNGVREQAEKELKSGHMGELRFLPNQRTFCCDVKMKTGGPGRITLRLHELEDKEKKEILEFCRKRPGRATAVGQGYLDRSFREFLRAKNISLVRRGYGEYLRCGNDGCCRDDERCAFILQQARLLENDPSLLLLWRGLDIKKELGLGAGASLQEPDEEALREYDEADPAGKRGKAAAQETAADDFLRRNFARRFIANLADDAIAGWKRDAAASRIAEPDFTGEKLSAAVLVRHGRSSSDRASLYLEPLSEEERQTVLRELGDDPHALLQLQLGKLDGQFAERLLSLGVPLMCGDSTGDCMKCTCEVSESKVCRHEIALLRRATQHVLSDPALIFRMRGFDLRAELKNLGMGKGTAPSWMAPEALLKIHPELDAKDTGDMLPEDALYHLNRTSFAKVPAGLLRSAMRLLRESPSGYGGADCRGAVLSSLDAARECAAAMTRPETEIVSLPDFSRCRAEISGDGRAADRGRTRSKSVFRITAGDSDPLSGRHLADKTGVPGSRLDRISPEKADALYTGLFWEAPAGGSGFEEMHSLPSGVFNGRITAEVLDRADTAAQAMYALCSLARKLVIADAVMPCPVRPENGNLFVMWIPCLLSHEVLTLAAHAGMLARKLLLGSVLVPDKSLGLKAEEMSDAGFGAYCLGLFITDLVRKGAIRSIGPAQSAWNRAMNETPELLLMTLSFWQYTELPHASLERMERPVGEWLAPLFIGQTGMRPVLILGTSFGKDPGIASAEERLRRGGEQAIADAEKAEDEEAGNKEEDLENASVEEQVSAEISLGFIDRDDGRYVSYGEVPGLDAGKRGECRAAAARISALLPEAADIISGKSDHATLSIEALQKALFEILPALKLSGALVVLPREMRRILRPMAMASLGLQKGWKGGSGLMSLTSLLTFDWKATLGGQEITEEQFEELRKHAGHLVRFGNDYVYATASEIDSILKRLSGKVQRPSRLRLLEAALSGTYEGSGVFMDNKIRKAIDKELRTPAAKVPEGLHATLRPYQERGYSWLMHNIRASMGSIIADDMGLGKTVQVIAALENLRAAGELEKDPALVTVPASVVINWTRELRRFAPELTVNVYYGTQRSLEPKANVLLTTYGTLRQDIEKLKDKKWRVAVADEAQNIKNTGSQIFQAMCLLKADSAIAMSGTPVENRLADYWAIMEFVNPGLFGTLGSFISDYARPIEQNRDADAVRRLRSVTAPFILRRLKTDKSVIADLPDKISSDRFCELTPEQAAMYQTFVSDGLEGVTETLSQLERSARVLKLILRLKQICDAPELFSKDPKITGPEHSGKAEMLLDLLEELTGNGQKAIVFTQFREMGDLLVSWIGERLGTVPDFIHGGVSVKKRQEMVDRFQNDPWDRVMVLSLKAAGTGLNLTAATAVIHYDLWWNPAVEDQATDRAYRIGQSRNVMVYRFICAGTFEEKINEIINSKKEIAELTVQKGEKWLGDLSKSELRSFLSMTSG